MKKYLFDTNGGIIFFLLIAALFLNLPTFLGILFVYIFRACYLGQLDAKQERRISERPKSINTFKSKSNE